MRDRELVVRMLGMGRTVEEIADLLGIPAQKAAEIQREQEEKN